MTAPDVPAAVASLTNAGPGGICEDCGHFAGRHIGYSCKWPESICLCRGMLWQGHRIEMREDYSGPKGLR